MTLATCIGCGCSDDIACWDCASEAPCHWLEIDRHAGLGVCSCCPDHQARWKAGDRSLSEQARINEVAVR